MGFKFGGSVRDHHTCTYITQVRNFNLAFAKAEYQTAKYNFPGYTVNAIINFTYLEIFSWGRGEGQREGGNTASLVLDISLLLIPFSLLMSISAHAPITG